MIFLVHHFHFMPPIPNNNNKLDMAQQIEGHFPILMPELGQGKVIKIKYSNLLPNFRTSIFAEWKCAWGKDSGRYILRARI
jgi:hypothetical protein